MRLALRRLIPVVLTGIGLASTSLHAQKGPAVGDVLKIAGDYLIQYSEKITGIAAEEQYVQADVSSGQLRRRKSRTDRSWRMLMPKRLTSDFVLYGSSTGAVATFRDVTAVDTRPVRQPDDRLVSLFKHTTPQSGDQARQIMEESVRYYLSPNLHAVDSPTLALEYLREDNQDCSTFTVEGVKNSNGAQFATLKFTDKSTSHLIPSSDGATAVGRFWIDVATGIVRQTEFSLTGENSSVRVTVKYAEQPSLGLWLPSEMYQQFEIGHRSTPTDNMGVAGGYGPHQLLEGRATYSKYRLLASGT